MFTNSGGLVHGQCCVLVSDVFLQQLPACCTQRLGICMPSCDWTAEAQLFQTAGPCHAHLRLVHCAIGRPVTLTCIGAGVGA